jgi:hypothetical protein
MGLLEVVIAGVIVLLALLLLTPGLRAMLRQSREARERDWAGFLIPIGLVVLFVLLLIALV